ncbi:hypothetical protein [Myceligenerans pegani]|uniref:Uncharacterized protein n=1 Tax=Myceligenerans pegani TaxID=2776917 RepID=A0ABR9N0D8_9MICO|nr:hypothetical protein [Myceligenerans sp. TRM 65318]MBE1876624.1 hypothetical protein [Myceligenerans sp. TRM 65318]MBE3018895.1 hypothetical protein [Myceligenerans sp. TRM 65318]
MNAAAARHLADGEPAAGIIPATVLDCLSDGECVVIWCQIGHLPGTDAKVVITRVGSRFETVVHTAGASPISMSQAMTGTTPSSYTIVRHGPDHILTTDGHTDAATAERWLAALRTGTATPWTDNTDNTDDFDHVRNWILAHAPGGLFTAITDRGAAIGIGGHAVRAGDVEVAMLTGTDVIASPRHSTSATRLHRLIARWRQAGAPYTEQLPAALFRQGHGWRVRLVVPRTEDAR